MIKIVRTNSEHNDFQKLVAELDADLRIRDGDEHAFYAQFNKTATIKHVIVAYLDDQPIGCGAIREYSSDTMEIKRMYVIPAQRGNGVASLMLRELERWTAELAFKQCILETGKNQPEAIAMYTKNDYTIIPNYGQYQNMENSVCFTKNL